jgi:hypothetical protein
MAAFKKIALTAALTALTVPAWAGLTYTGTGSYNLGSASGPGGTVAMSSSCGNISGQDTLEFNGSGVNNIGIHAYSCDDSLSNFGSRSSGQNTYYAQGVASVTGSLVVGENDGFSFFVNAGEVGAFGSTAFTAGELQKASLTIKLVIDGTTYMDEAWSAEVGTGGAITNSHVSGVDSLLVGTTETSGAGYFSYGLAGGFYSINLAAGTHDISYVMASESFGNILTTGACTAVLYGGGQEAAAREGNADAVVKEGPGAGDPFTSYCGAGARSGDPFNDPIATPFDGQLPEPMSASLALTALLAAAGVRRRAGKR